MIKKSMAQEQEGLREGLHGYLSKSEKFSVRMSKAMKSGAINDHDD